MIIQFLKEKNQYRRGVATCNDCIIEFTIGERGYINEVIITTKNVSDTFLIKLIETLLMESYTKLIYNNIRYCRNSDVREVMKNAAPCKAS